MVWVLHSLFIEVRQQKRTKKQFMSKVIFLLIPLFAFSSLSLMANEDKIDWQKQLEIALNSPDAYNRGIALGSIGDAIRQGETNPVPDSLINGLIHALNDPSKDVVSDAITALTFSRSSKAQEVLANLIRNQAFDSTVLEETARATVSAINDSLTPLSDYEAAFQEDLNDDATKIVNELLSYHRHEPEGVIQILRNTLRDNDVSPYMKREIIQALWNWGPFPYRVPLHRDLEGYLQNSNIKTEDGKIKMAEALYFVDSFNPEKALSYFQSILDDPNEWKSVKENIINVIDIRLSASEKEAFAKKILGFNRIDDPELLEKLRKMAEGDSLPGGITSGSFTIDSESLKKLGIIINSVGGSSDAQQPPQSGESEMKIRHPIGCVAMGGLTGTVDQIVKTAQNVSQISAAENERESGVQSQRRSNDHKLIKERLSSTYAELKEVIDNFNHEKTEDLYKEIIQLNNDINYSHESGVFPAITRVAEVFGYNEFGTHETTRKKIDENRYLIRKMEQEKLLPAIERFNRAYDESIIFIRRIQSKSQIKEFKDTDFEGKYDYALAKLNAISEDQKKE